MRKSKVKYASAISVVIMFTPIIAMTMLLVSGCEKKDSNVAKVGVNLSLTGSLAYWGTQLKQGMEIAVAESNENKQAEKLQVIFEDNQGQAKNAISIFQKFASVEKVSAIVTAHTYIAQPQRPLAQQYQIPLLATIVSAVGFGKENSWSFLDSPTHDQITPPVADYVARDLQAKTAVILVVNDDYGTDGASFFKQEFERDGGKVTGQETFGNTDKEMRSQLTAIQTVANPTGTVLGDPS